MTWQKTMDRKEALGILEYISKYSYTYLNSGISNKPQEALKVAIEYLKVPTVNEIIEALKKDTEIDTWYYDEELKVFWSGEDNECEEVGEKYHTAYMTNDTRHMITKFFKGERK